MRQLVVECSDPGLVVYLAEEFEHVMRHVDFCRAQSLSQQLGDLARELGPEFAQAWQGFHLEVPNDGGYPPSFGKREWSGEEAEEKKLLQGFLTQAGERGLGTFELRDTILLPEDGPAPETREQYIRDLADGIRRAEWEELGRFRFPTDLPASMAAHRQQLMDELGMGVLRDRARHPSVGHRWVQDSTDRVKKALEEVNTRAEAVMEYELDRLDPADLESVERIRWAAMAVRLGRGVEKWFQAAVEPLAYLYQQAALVSVLWTECGGWGRAIPFLEEQLKAVIEQAPEVYTADGVEALRLLHKDLRRSPFGRLLGLSDDEEKGEDEGLALEE